MSDCCSENNFEANEKFSCPKCNKFGKPVQTITLKSLLIPDALVRFNPNTSYQFCGNSQCDVVYFSKDEEIFTTADIKVMVYQKTTDKNCPVCYCFGWTRDKIERELLKTDSSSIIQTISGHMKAGRCGCDVNNPQGSCCLGNVKQTMSK